MARRSLKRYTPALINIGAVTMDDMNAQIVTQTFVINSKNSLIAIGNSQKNSNVVGFFVPQGFSIPVSLFEVTTPTQNTYMFTLNTANGSGMWGDIASYMGNAYGRLFIVPTHD